MYKSILMNFEIFHFHYKVGCVFPMVVVSMLFHAEIGRIDHREGAPHFSNPNLTLKIPKFASKNFRIIFAIKKVIFNTWKMGEKKFSMRFSEGGLKNIYKNQFRMVEN